MSDRTRKHNSHNTPVANLEPEAQRRLREIQQDDVDELLSMCLRGEPRVWGMREGRVLHLLWWDPTHSVHKTKRRK